MIKKRDCLYFEGPGDIVAAHAAWAARCNFIGETSVMGTVANVCAVICVDTDRVPSYIDEIRSLNAEIARCSRSAIRRAGMTMA